MNAIESTLDFNYRNCKKHVLKADGYLNWYALSLLNMFINLITLCKVIYPGHVIRKVH